MFIQYPKFTLKYKKNIKDKYINFENCKKPVHYFLEFFNKKMKNHIFDVSKNEIGN